MIGRAGEVVARRSLDFYEAVALRLAGTVKVYLDGVRAARGLVGRHNNRSRHLQHGAGAGVEVTADFEFDVPVRFDTDHMAVTIESYRLHAWQQIAIVKLRG